MTDGQPPSPSTVHRPAAHTSRGQGARGLPSLCSCQKGTQETKVCCPPLSSLEPSSRARPVPGLLPLPPPRCHFGQQGRFLLGRQRSQTAEILKASYFSSKHISPHLEALELPWDIPDLTLTFCCPSIWNPSGPSMLMSLPAGETKSFCSGWGFAHSLIPRPPKGSQEVSSWDWLSNPSVARAGKSSLVGQTLPSSKQTCQLLSEATLLFGMAKKKKKKKILFLVLVKREHKTFK